MGAQQKKIAVIDCETDPFLYGRTPKPFVWGFFDGETYLYFWGDECTTQLIDYLKDETDLILYAHNGGKFDFFYLLKYLDSDVSIINGRIARASLFNKAIELRDSYLILPLPLSAHDKDSIDYGLMERDKRELHKGEILKYLQKDCSSLYEWVKMFRDEFGGGLTLAGSAFKQLKKTDYPYTPTSLSFDDAMRPFYKGGRVQCFDVGAFVGDYTYVDIHSAYPFAMTHKHWVGSQYKEVLRIPDKEGGSWYAKIKAVSKGALPFHCDNKTYYPDDNTEREYYASGWEIIAGLKTNTLKINKIMRVYIPQFTADFCEYVDKFFKMKAEADIERAKHPEDSAAYRYWDTIRTFAKLMLNSCYGKFGQDGRNFEAYMLLEYGDAPEPYIDEKIKNNLIRKGAEIEEAKLQAKTYWNKYSEAANMMSIYSRPDPVERFYNVATAASITGFVRAYLWENICKSEGVLYCDTDSIICKKFGGNISDKLGDWGLEANLKECYIAQRKMYACLTDKGKHKIASKGVRLNYDQIKHGVLSGENIDFSRDAPAFSLKFGARFTSREIDFKNLAKNACTNPQELYNGKTRSKADSKSVTYDLAEVLSI